MLRRGLLPVLLLLGATTGCLGTGPSGRPPATTDEPEPNLPPLARFALRTVRPAVGEPVAFTDESHDPDGRIVAWLWRFADGESSGERDPVHAFPWGRAYVVRLTVTDDAGAASTTELKVVVGQGDVEIHDVGYTEAGCTQEVPVWFHILSTRDEALEGVRVRLSGGLNDVTAEIERLGPGERRRVDLVARAADECGERSDHQLTIHVLPPEGAASRRDFWIRI